MDLSKRAGELAQELSGKVFSNCKVRGSTDTQVAARFEFSINVTAIEDAIKQGMREALAEPDEEMLIAGWEACQACPMCISSRAEPRAAWNAMAAIRLREK